MLAMQFCVTVDVNRAQLFVAFQVSLGQWSVDAADEAKTNFVPAGWRSAGYVPATLIRPHFRLGLARWNEVNCSQMVNDRRPYPVEQFGNRFPYRGYPAGAGQKLAGPFAPGDVHRSPYCQYVDFAISLSDQLTHQFPAHVSVPARYQNRTVGHNKRSLE